MGRDGADEEDRRERRRRRRERRRAKEETRVLEEPPALQMKELAGERVNPAYEDAEEAERAEETEKPPMKPSNGAPKGRIRFLEEEEKKGKAFKETHRFKTFAEALEHVGSFGKYQIFTCAVVQYASILWAGNYSFLTLGTIEPDWRCRLPGYENKTWSAPANQTDPDFCEMIRNCSGVMLGGAPALVKVTNGFVSLVESYELVCAKAFVPDLIHSIYLAGRIAGSVVGGHIGDHLGRRRGFFSGQFCIIISSVLSICSLRWEVFAAFQAVNGFFFGLIEVTAMTLMMEYTDSRHRLIPNAMFQWCLGFMVITLVGFLTADWRMYLIFINLLAAPLLVGYLLFHESPRWLVTKGLLHDAAEVLTDIGSDRWNSVPNSEVTPEMLQDIPRAEKDRLYTFTHLFRGKRLIWQSVLQMLSILTFSLIDATYFYDKGFIGMGPFMHLFFYGFLRVWLPILIIWLDFRLPNFGRKSLLMGSLGISGAAFTVSAVLLGSGVSRRHWANVVATLVGTTVNVSAFYMAIVQITTVAYPTVIRATAFGTLHITTDVGQLLAFLLIIPASQSFAALPYIVPLALIILTAALTYFYQPETKGLPLPDRYQDVRKAD